MKMLTLFGAGVLAAGTLVAAAPSADAQRYGYRGHHYAPRYYGGGYRAHYRPIYRPVYRYGYRYRGGYRGYHHVPRGYYGGYRARYRHYR